MNKKFLVKLGAPIIALSLVAACGTDDDMDPVEDEAPLNEEDEAPLNPDDNGGMNDDPNMDDGLDNGNGENTPDDDLGNQDEENGGGVGDQ